MQRGQGREADAARGQRDRPGRDERGRRAGRERKAAGAASVVGHEHGAFAGGDRSFGLGHGEVRGRHYG